MALSENLLSIDEIFLSMQGESTLAGYLCTFVRVYGCSVGCSFCDQPQTKEDRHRMKVSEVVSAVSALGVKRICITGGEPLMQWNAVLPLILELQYLGYSISIETSGCFPIARDDLYNRSYNYVMDVKCPSSGVAEKNVLENLMNLKMKDEVKFVIGNKDDYEYMKDVLRKYPTSAKLLISPCFTPDFKPMVGKELIDWMIEDNLQQIRVQVQIHKLIGVQ